MPELSQVLATTLPVDGHKIHTLFLVRVFKKKKCKFDKQKEGHIAWYLSAQYICHGEGRKLIYVKILTPHVALYRLSPPRRLWIWEMADIIRLLSIPLLYASLFRCFIPWSLISWAHSPPLWHGISPPTSTRKNLPSFYVLIWQTLSPPAPWRILGSILLYLLVSIDGWMAGYGRLSTSGASNKTWDLLQQLNATTD